MTRLVGGVAGGRPLIVPDKGTRPTSDRARAALFSSLDTLIELPGARVLDLFAGTGAVGLEAASRGAVSVTLVDSGRDAATALRRNVDAVGLPGVVIRTQSVESFVDGPAPGPLEGFDVVFADPPYAYPDADLARLLGVLATGDDWLAPDAVVVVERSKRGGPPAWPDVIQPIKDKRYGESVLWYGRRIRRAEDPT